MNYEVVFDAGQAGYRQLGLPAVPLFIAAVGTVVLIFRGKDKSSSQTDQTRWFLYCFIGFSLLIATVAFVGTFTQYWRLREALRTGRFLVVEGEVVDFVPMPVHGHADESFTVNGRRYKYSDYEVSAGF